MEIGVDIRGADAQAPGEGRNVVDGIQGCCCGGVQGHWNSIQAEVKPVHRLERGDSRGDGQVEEWKAADQLALCADQPGDDRRATGGIDDEALQRHRNAASCESKAAGMQDVAFRCVQIDGAADEGEVRSAVVNPGGETVPGVTLREVSAPTKVLLS